MEHVEGKPTGVGWNNNNNDWGMWNRLSTNIGLGHQVWNAKIQMIALQKSDNFTEGNADFNTGKNLKPHGFKYQRCQYIQLGSVSLPKKKTIKMKQN